MRGMMIGVNMELYGLIAARPEGDIACILQAASEVEGTLEERLRQGYLEIVGE